MSAENQKKEINKSRVPLRPVELSPGLLCAGGGSVGGDGWRLSGPHHPRQPLEGVSVECTSLDVAVDEKEQVLLSFRPLKMWMSKHETGRPACK